MLDEERAAVAREVGSLAELTPGRTGNLSVRRGDRFAVTPTGVPYDDLSADEVSVVSLEGEHLAGADPSSEGPMHRGIYRTFEAGAIAHVHSPWATTLAVLHEPVPPVHYAIANAGGEVPVAEYATYGTKELADNAVAAMDEAGTSATLLANHGVVATGADAVAAIETARAVEATARLYGQARGIGDPTTLPDEEIQRVAEKFESYGQGED
ncbi:class II aldolase [Halobacteriales archaeon QS_8_69_26]|nr:MAG: class II aldolase [Halobacteriales archaeon QS_8_69_26]